jgi:sugar phosphate isomerase/epimerase
MIVGQMHNLRIAVATRCFGQPLKQAVQTAFDIGVQGVQLDAVNEIRPRGLSETGRRQFLHQLGELQLSVASLQFSARGPFLDLEGLDSWVAAAKTVLQFAFQLNCPVVTTHLGPIATDAGSEQRRLLLAVLNDLARHGSHVGATLCITPAGDSPHAVAELVNEVTEGRIGVNFDPAAFLLAGHDPSEAFQTLHDSILHAVARDAIRDAAGGGAEARVGKGEVAWHELLAIIDATNYRGWLTIERAGDTHQLSGITQAVNYLRSVARS